MQLASRPTLQHDCRAVQRKNKSPILPAESEACNSPWQRHALSSSRAFHSRAVGGSSGKGNGGDRIGQASRRANRHGGESAHGRDGDSRRAALQQRRQQRQRQQAGVATARSQGYAAARAAQLARLQVAVKLGHAGRLPDPLGGQSLSR
jgi:hypothetical protein